MTTVQISGDLPPRGFGFSAYVAVGWVEGRTGRLDQSHLPCPLLAPGAKEEGVEESRAEGGIYKLRRPLDLSSRYQAFLARQAEEPSSLEEEGEEQQEQQDTEVFHGWVYLEVGATSFFLEPTTGLRHAITAPAYSRINCLYNDHNYWLNLRGTALTRRGKTLDISNRAKWLPLVQDIRQPEDKTKAKEKKMAESVGIGLMKIVRKEDTLEEEELEETVKRPFDVMSSWVEELDIPRDSYDLMYRLGQKTEKYFETKVEYYAAYLLKDGMVQRMTEYESNFPEAEELRTVVKFRNRADKLVGKVVEKREGRLTEQFDLGRPDRLEQLVYISQSGEEQETVKVHQFYHKARKDGLATREAREWEIKDTYLGREDCLISMDVSFGLPDKKFGPADDDEARNPRKILTITERYSLPEGGEPRKSVAERFYDLEEETIKLKFHREKDRILCQTVEMARPAEGQRTIGEDEVSVYVVDPREKGPDLKELQKMYKVQVEHQAVAVGRVKVMEEELATLADLRMKEESTTELSVGLFDTKRNIRVQKGREAQEKERREREKSEVDLELDFLAPFLVKYGGTEAMTRKVALQVRDECLESITASMAEKELALTKQLQKLKAELEGMKTTSPMVEQDLNSKKFFINVLETRIRRQQAYSKNQSLLAEKKIRADPRLTKFL